MNISSNKNFISSDKTKLFSRGIPLTSIDYHSTQFFEVIINEDIDATVDPVLITLDFDNPIDGDYIRGKRLNQSDEVIIGVMSKQIAKNGDIVKLITRGNVVFENFPQPLLNKNVYVGVEGLTTKKQLYAFKKFGRIVSLNPTTIFINIDSEPQIESIRNDLEFGSIENAINKIDTVRGVIPTTTYFGNNFSPPLNSIPLPGQNLVLHLGAVSFLDKIIFLGSQHVAVLDTNPFGTWSVIPIEMQYWKKLIVGNDMLLAVSPNKIAYSYDAFNWVVSDAAKGRDVAYGNNTFVIVGDSGTYISTDGINWDNGISVLHEVVFGNNKFIGYLSPPSSYFCRMEPPYSVNWLSLTPPLPSGEHMTYGAGKFVLIRDIDTKISYSYDGISWIDGGNISSVPGEIGLGYPITYTDGLFTMLLQNINGTRILHHSFDGIKWFKGNRYITDRYSALKNNYFVEFSHNQYSGLMINSL